jgi:hypothetical protein
MAGNPNINVGYLNRLLGSVIIPDIPALNITPPFLAKDAISWEPQGVATAMLPGLTSAVVSPEPYMLTRVTIHLLKSLALADAWLQQIESDTQLGVVTFRFDSPVINPRSLQNCAITSISPVTANGLDAGLVIGVEGSWNINGQLWP